MFMKERRPLRAGGDSGEVSIQLGWDDALGLVLTVEVTVGGVEFEAVEIPLGRPLERFRAWREERREPSGELEVEDESA